jgi:hypothetical protein
MRNPWLGFYSGASPERYRMMWRNASAMPVRSIDGQGRRYETGAQAIGVLFRKQRDALMDIEAPHWLIVRSSKIPASRSHRQPDDRVFVFTSMTRSRLRGRG